MLPSRGLLPYLLTRSLFSQHCLFWRYTVLPNRQCAAPRPHVPLLADALLPQHHQRGVVRHVVRAALHRHLVCGVHLSKGPVIRRQAEGNPGASSSYAHVKMTCYLHYSRCSTASCIATATPACHPRAYVAMDSKHPVLNETVLHRSMLAIAPPQAVLYGIFPVIAGSSVLCEGYLWWMMRAAKRFKGLQPGTKVHKIYKFDDPHDVERLSRAMRKFDIDGEIEEEAAALGETIIKAGMQTFPKSPFLLILYANFLLEVRKDGPASRTQLQLASKLAPGLVERYQGGLCPYLCRTGPGQSGRTDGFVRKQCGSVAQVHSRKEGVRILPRSVSKGVLPVCAGALQGFCSYQ